MQNETTLKAGATMSFRKTMTVAEQAFFVSVDRRHLVSRVFHVAGYRLAACR
ncbi:hypothetical protein ACQUFY_16140 [Robbsia andropogonis]|uniref:hypothetical protein n=1 Tax=Robbsia andropogonis TaxID=28092 RepID=UPI003D1AF703